MLVDLGHLCWDVDIQNKEIQQIVTSAKKVSVFELYYEVEIKNILLKMLWQYSFMRFTMHRQPTLQKSHFYISWSTLVYLLRFFAVDCSKNVVSHNIMIVSKNTFSRINSKIIMYILGCSKYFELEAVNYNFLCILRVQ